MRAPGEAISGEKPPGSAHLARPGNRKSARKINYWKGLIIRL